MAHIELMDRSLVGAILSMTAGGFEWAPENK